MKINRNNEFINVDVHILPRFIESKDKVFKREVKNSVEDFVVIILRDCKNINLENFRKNFSTLKFNLEKQKIDDNLGGTAIGAYDVLSNEIFIYSIIAINHELMHMSSTKFKGNLILSVFSLFHSFKPIMNNYFNEGYTQLLTERYFEDVYISKAYKFAVSVSREIENIIGKDLMENLYFNADFLGLVNELKKYRSYDNIVQFFKALEFLGVTNNYVLGEDILK